MAKSKARVPSTDEILKARYPKLKQATPEQILKCSPNNQFNYTQCAATVKCAVPTFYQRYVWSGLLVSAKRPDGQVVTTRENLLIAYLSFCELRQRDLDAAAKERHLIAKQIKEAGA